jgi:carboxyl-terminal processing protease
MQRLLAWLPLICGAMLGAGVWIGSFLPGGASSGTQQDAAQKIRDVIRFADRYYVDSVDQNVLADDAISAMLQNLDPHSDYFTSEEIKEMNEPMQGKFEGIGIEYNILRDTVVVLNVIKGGPSERAGLNVGDKLLKADNQIITGKKVSEKDIRSKLRGPSGTEVKIEIMQGTDKKLSTVTIVRGSIPIRSVDIAYMMDKETGFIKLLRFSETSYAEFKAASDSLMALGMKKIIFDLRGNGGGLLSAAVDICDEFLPSGKMIVYTKGRHASSNDEYRATAKGGLEQIKVAVLIDENSASASEIVAGALQDNDRATIYGRRSFGKGLVQQEKMLSDGSALRLTISRYYTPAGRSIQKSYENGIGEYMHEESNRYQSGELFHRDSIKLPDSLKYKTASGKVVYGGGGIMPDVFIPLDTIGRSQHLTDLFYGNVFTMWALDYIGKNEKRLRKDGLNRFIASYQPDGKTVQEVLAYSEKKNSSPKNLSNNAEALLKRYIKNAIIRTVWGDLGYYTFWNLEDTVVQQAYMDLNK